MMIHLIHVPIHPPTTPSACHTKRVRDMRTELDSDPEGHCEVDETDRIELHACT